ncbi:MAG: VWA domain-containing protein [Steroidobacteraceae bacterium]
MKLKRRETEIFTLSFLDCICCGFGAVILLLVLSNAGEPPILESTRVALNGQVAKLQEERFQIRGETEVFNRDLKGRIEQLSAEKARIARLQGDLTAIRGQFSASTREGSSVNSEESELVAAYQKLTAEMQRLLAQSNRRPTREAVGGIPVDSEYIIFVIDTSSSMTEFHWTVAARTLTEILDIYPRVKGIQVLNDQGKYMFEGTTRQWLADSEQRRQEILRKFPNWKPYSRSSPVEGIEEAIRDFWSANHKTSIYVFGDDFTGPSVQDVIDEVDRLNRTAGGVRRMRIHAIGFPTSDEVSFSASLRYGALMRALCDRNGGTFVGLNR